MAEIYAATPSFVSSADQKMAQMRTPLHSQAIEEILMINSDGAPQSLGAITETETLWGWPRVVLAVVYRILRHRE